MVPLQGVNSPSPIGFNWHLYLHQNLNVPNQFPDNSAIVTFFGMFFSMVKWTELQSSVTSNVWGSSWVTSWVTRLCHNSQPFYSSRFCVVQMPPCWRWRKRYLWEKKKHSLGTSESILLVLDMSHKWIPNSHRQTDWQSIIWLIVVWMYLPNQNVIILVVTGIMGWTQIIVKKYTLN